MIRPFFDSLSFSLSLSPRSLSSLSQATIASLRADLAEAHSIRLRQQQELDMVKAEKDRLTLAVSDAALNQRVRTLQKENTALLRQAESMNQSIEALKAQLGRAHANEAQAQAQFRAQVITTPIQAPI